MPLEARLEGELAGLGGDDSVAEPGPAVPEAALDLRPAELGIVVPLVACLLALSAWPAAISGNAVEATADLSPLAPLGAASSTTPLTEAENAG